MDQDITGIPVNVLLSSPEFVEAYREGADRKSALNHPPMREVSYAEAARRGWAT